MKLPFPDSVLSQHVIALGKTRAGKSSKLRLIVEHLLEKEIPACIIDPKGDWWGLKSSADGRRAGFPVVIFGGEHGDVPLNPAAGAAVAELIATGNRPSLIDLGGWMVGDRTRFFVDFASTFFRLSRGRRYLVIDEVHNFAPQGKVLDVDAGKMLHWANRLASEGAGKGITLIAASQRPQKVHKDLVTSCETLIACRVIHKLDRDAIKDWIDGCADPAAGRQVLTELAGMERAEAWVWSPEVGFGPKRVTFPMFHTYDSFRPQEAATARLKGWAAVDLDDVRARLQSVVAEAEANDPKRLRARIAELERQVGAGKRGGDEDLAYKSGYDTGHAHGFESGAQAGRRMGHAFLSEAVRRHAAQVEAAVRGALKSAVDEFVRSLPNVPAPTYQKSTTVQRGRQVFPVSKPLIVGASYRMPDGGIQSVAAAGPVSTRLKPGKNPGGNGTVSPQIGTGGKHRIMVALAQQGRPTDQRRLGLLTGLSPRSGTWSTYLSELRKNNFIEGREALTITAAGLEALGSFEPLPTGEALIEYWRGRLGASGKRAIFDAVVKAFPGEIDQEKVGAETNLSPRSGTWSTYLSELRGLGLIEGRAKLRMSQDLLE